MYNIHCTLSASIHICFVYTPPREETKHFYSMRRKRAFLVRKKGMTWTYFGRALIWFCLLLIIPPIDHDLAREDLVIIAALLIDWLFCSSSNQNNNWSTSFHSRSHRFSSSSIFNIVQEKRCRLYCVDISWQAPSYTTCHSHPVLGFSKTKSTSELVFVAFFLLSPFYSYRRVYPKDLVLQNCTSPAAHIHLWRKVQQLSCRRGNY